MNLRISAAMTAVVAALSFTPAAPATASEGWEHIASGSISLQRADLVGDVIAAATSTFGAAVCSPKTRETGVGNLDYDVWWSPSTAEIAYHWHGTGWGTVSADCADGVRVTVQVSDYAPLGQPPVVRGNPETGTKESAGTVYATAHAWVPYYVPLSLYQRGNSVVEVRARSWYRNGRGQWVPLGCSSSFVPITPTPVGPVQGQAQTQPCPPV